MTMRGKFTEPGTSIHYYVVEFDPTKLSCDPQCQNTPARAKVPVRPLAAPQARPLARGWPLGPGRRALAAWVPRRG